MKRLSQGDVCMKVHILKKIHWGLYFTKSDCELISRGDNSKDGMS